MKVTNMYHMTFLVMIILLQCGDIQANPGPTKSLHCDNCKYDTTIELNPQELSPNSMKAMSWECPNCTNFILANIFLFDNIQLIPNRFALQDTSNNTNVRYSNANTVNTNITHIQPDTFQNKLIKILTININSIKGEEKNTKFTGLVALEDPDIIIGTESKLDPSMKNAEIFPENYDIVRKDRSKYGGGVFIAAKKITSNGRNSS